MRSLHVITDRDRRGAQVYAVDLAENLARLGGVHDVVALTPGTAGDLLEVDALGPTRRGAATFRALRERARCYDVVVAHGSATLLACAVSLSGTGTPFVYRQISDPLHWAGTWARRLRVGLFLRRAAGVVALSDAAAAVVAAHYRLPSTRITVIPNAVPLQRFREVDASRRAVERERYGIEASAALAIYVGALVPEKGVDIAIEATAAIETLHLLVVGDGPSRDSLRELASELAPRRVTFTGAVNDAADAMRAGDLLLMPSRAGDSMPAVLIEAGLIGLAVVATDVGSITDVVVDRVTGRVVPPGDLGAFMKATSELIADDDERARYGAAARSRCEERFTFETNARAWMDLLTATSR